MDPPFISAPSLAERILASLRLQSDSSAAAESRDCPGVSPTHSLTVQTLQQWQGDSEEMG